MESNTSAWCDQPVSPTAQYFSSSVLSVSILGVFEIEVPIDTSTALTLLKNVYVPLNKRFSSIMVTDEQGVKHWKPVKVKYEDHLKVPIFPDGLLPESYDVHLQEYISKIAMDQLPQTRPLWEVHIINYPTSNAAATCIFKLHHALGDGYSLMGALLSCSRRADDPSLPLTFPSIRSIHKEKNMFKSVLRNSSMLWNTALDFATSFLKSTVVADDETPIRSRIDGMEFRPINVSTTTFSLDHIKQIKAKIGGTVNDIVVGTIFYGLRLYMQSVSKDSNHSRSTSLMLLNTRGMNGYVTVEEMLKPKAKSLWGNQFAFIHVTIPNSKDADTDEDPLKFISKTRKTIERKKKSLTVYLTGLSLEIVRKLRGAEAASRYIYKTFRNTSITITNMIGPVEQITIGDSPCKGMYFAVVNGPQSLMVSIMSYMGKLKLGIGAEKDYIDHQLLISCFDKAFRKISEAALSTK